MGRAPNSWITAALGLVACAGAAVAASGRERSVAVYPVQVVPLKFDHALHLEADLECVSCHDLARGSERGSDNLLPGRGKDPHAECSDCHDVDAARKGARTKAGDPPGECEACHVGFDQTARRTPARVQFPAPNLLFPHKVHVDRKIACKSCHGAMTDVGLATRMQLPKMETCLPCHDGHFASAACTTCHLKEPSGRLQQRFDSGVLRPAQGNPLGVDHGPRFEFTHGNRAAVARQACLECHSESSCMSCHDALQKPLPVHPNDFITLHPLQARTGATQCESCHRTQSFCAACHERVGVGQSADSRFLPRNAIVHPNRETWVENLGPEHHGFAAARNLTQCMACHREESCLGCHAAGTVQGASRSVTPHPTDFASRCRSYFQKNAVACLKCHLPGIEERCR